MQGQVRALVDFYKRINLYLTHPDEDRRDVAYRTEITA